MNLTVIVKNKNEAFFNVDHIKMYELNGLYFLRIAIGEKEHEIWSSGNADEGNMILDRLYSCIKNSKDKIFEV